MEQKGLVQVYTGLGKGKTTAALGLAIRAAGHNKKTAIIQFMKSPLSGERKIIEGISQIIIKSFGNKEFVNYNNLDKSDFESAAKAFQYTKEILQKGEFDIVVLDEINIAIDHGLIKIESVLDLIKNKPPQIELILTGRYASPEIIQKADLVTEMLNIKHYYPQGVKAREGIEY